MTTFKNLLTLMICGLAIYGAYALSRKPLPPETVVVYATPVPTPTPTTPTPEPIVAAPSPTPKRPFFENRTADTNPLNRPAHSQKEDAVKGAPTIYRPVTRSRAYGPGQEPQ